MTADKVFASPQFQKLSEQQRAFIKALTENGWDKLDAAQKAWKCGTPESALAMADRALRNARVAPLIALMDPAKSRMTKAEALEIAAKHARTAEKTADVLKCLELISELEGWSTQAPGPKTADDESLSIYERAAALEKQNERFIERAEAEPTV